MTYEALFHKMSGFVRACPGFVRTLSARTAGQMLIYKHCPVRSGPDVQGQRNERENHGKKP